jgi:anti-sigma regulatory factor (Ser/Thr protein kinase)
MDDSKNQLRSGPVTRNSAPAGRRPPAAPANAGALPARSAGIRIPPFIMRPERGANGSWPRRDFLELGALAGAVPCARLHTRHVLREWGLARLSESAELLVTELVTNAVKVCRAVTQASAVRLWLMSDAAQILILVWDASPEPPVRVDANGEAENGRGLMLVEAISTQWGWYHDGSGWKIVWALV